MAGQVKAPRRSIHGLVSVSGPDELLAVVAHFASQTDGAPPPALTLEPYVCGESIAWAVHFDDLIAPDSAAANRALLGLEGVEVEEFRVAPSEEEAARDRLSEARAAAERAEARLAKQIKLLGGKWFSPATAFQHLSADTEVLYQTRRGAWLLSSEVPLHGYGDRVSHGDEPRFCYRLSCADVETWKAANGFSDELLPELEV